MKLWPRTLTIPRAPDFIVGTAADPYLRRWFVIPRNRWFNVYLHQFCRSDDPRALHDHPWANVSILLRGLYLEVTPDGTFLRSPFRPVVRRASALHRVELIGGQPVWSLFITGPVVREWGFACPRGWRHWKEFVTQRPGGNEVGPGCE